MIGEITEIARGMGVTLKNFFKKPLTVQYPKHMRNYHPRFRGAVGFVRDQETGKERCVGCGLCSAVCPANCLTVVPGVDEVGIRNARIYLYDMSRCVFCGMCVEVCPELALVMTHEFELAVRDRSELVLDAEAMLALADRELERTGQAIEEPGFPAIKRGKFPTHQPFMGTAPHGYPMPYEDYLKKVRSGQPLAQGTLPPRLQEIQNDYLPEDRQTPMPKSAQVIADWKKAPRTNLLTAADNPVREHIMEEDNPGRIGDTGKRDPKRR
jgi:NADH-quinone oxidoreductase subunit I